MNENMEFAEANTTSREGKIKVYKFRPLGNKEEFRRFKEILETEEFHCSKFSELNDPMEGTFTATNSSTLIDSIFKGKSNYKICSFSARRALSNPLMWGYYANGFRGAAIEVEAYIHRVRKVNYTNSIPMIENTISDNTNTDRIVEEILTTKFTSWRHECEYRFLKKTENDKIKIGEISAIYFGAPYRRAVNRNSIIADSDRLIEYERFRKNIYDLRRDIKFYLTSIDSRITIQIQSLGDLNS